MKKHKYKKWVCICGLRLQTDDVLEWANWMDMHRRHGVHIEEA